MTYRRRCCRSCKISIYTPSQSFPRLLFVRQAGCVLPGVMSILSTLPVPLHRATTRTELVPVSRVASFPRPSCSSFSPLLSFLVLSHSRLLSFNSTHLWGKSSNSLFCSVLSAESSSAPKEGSRWALSGSDARNNLAVDRVISM
ncbi:hypothetical protein K456DRAFT_1248013 [Colletotrichum gloeosporioides 23]|nr:hypothetical protein K456DRAFT_1248013 [Colletotrichum gloeosporioides 23]